MKRSASPTPPSKYYKVQGKKRTYDEMIAGLPGRQNWSLPREKKQQYYNLNNSSSIQEQLDAYRESKKSDYYRYKQNKRSSKKKRKSRQNSRKKLRQRSRRKFT